MRKTTGACLPNCSPLLAAPLSNRCNASSRPSREKHNKGHLHTRICRWRKQKVTPLEASRGVTRAYGIGHIGGGVGVGVGVSAGTGVSVGTGAGVPVGTGVGVPVDDGVSVGVSVAVGGETTGTGVAGCGGGTTGTGVPVIAVGEN